MILKEMSCTLEGLSVWVVRTTQAQSACAALPEASREAKSRSSLPFDYGPFAARLALSGGRRLNRQLKGDQLTFVNPVQCTDRGKGPAANTSFATLQPKCALLRRLFTEEPDALFMFPKL